MTVLDSFVAFARALPDERREQIEESLAALMESFSSTYGFSAEETEELQRRAAEVQPELSDPADIARLFGKSFRA